jgi:hypothetical protein
MFRAFAYNGRNVVTELGDFNTRLQATAELELTLSSFIREMPDTYADEFIEQFWHYSIVAPTGDK